MTSRDRPRTQPMSASVQTTEAMARRIGKRRAAERRFRTYGIVSPGASFMLRERVIADPGIIGRGQRVWVPADDDIDVLIKGHIDRNAPEAERRVKDDQIAWVTAIEEAGRIEKRFNTTFFTAGDSREPELAGIRGAAVGSFFTLLVTLVWTSPAPPSTRSRRRASRSSSTSCGRTTPS